MLVLCFLLLLPRPFFIRQQPFELLPTLPVPYSGLPSLFIAELCLQKVIFLVVFDGGWRFVSVLGQLFVHEVVEALQFCRFVFGAYIATGVRELFMCSCTI